MGDQRSFREFDNMEIDEDEMYPDEVADMDNEGPADSLEPLTFHDKTQKDSFKDKLSTALSIFNLMNAILGSGILGLGEAVKNMGLVLFIILLLSTASLALYTITMLLHMSKLTRIKSYEGLAKKAFGFKGRVVTSIMIIFHCLGAICSYMYIIKTELPEIIKVFIDYHHDDEVADPWYTDGNILMILVTLIVIVPLAALKDIKFLGYSSGFGMACMILFAFTVIIKKFSIPCPLPNHLNATGTVAPFNSSSSHHDEDGDEEQYCSAKAFNFNSRTAYAVPTMFFSFMCHASMLPIYAELRRPTIRRMQKVAGISIFNVCTLYLLSALFGYLTFFNKVKSELLLTYSLYNPHDTLIVISRVMVLICVTLSVPLLHYPARKTVIITTFPKSYTEFSWIRHLLVMVIILSTSVFSVLFVPNIRDIFGIAGATSSASLLAIFPSAFLIKILEKETTKNQQIYHRHKYAAWVMVILGTAFCILSVSLIIFDWVK